MYLTDFEAYLFWAIPSVLGVVLNCLVLVNIAGCPSLRNKYYQLWSALLAGANLLSSGSWLIGPKYSYPQTLCAVQEYIFMVASMWQAVISLFICYIAMASVVWRDQPSPRKMAGILLALLLLALLLVGGCVLNQTAGLFCSNDLDDFYSNGKWSYSFVVYVSLFIFPIMLAVTAECFLCLLTIRRLMRGIAMSASGQDRPVESNYRKQMLLFSRRLLSYPLIYIFSWTLNIVSIVHSMITRRYNIALGFFAGLMMASCSIIMGLNYFYFQHTFAPFFVPLMKRLGKRHVSTHSVSTSRSRTSGAELSSALAGGSSSSGLSQATSPSECSFSSSSSSPSPSRAALTATDLLALHASSTGLRRDEVYVQFEDDDDGDGDSDRFSVQ
jgi:hypothetical protein